MRDEWIKLNRKLLDNPMWLERPFSKGQAWVDLLLLANHKVDGFTTRKRGVVFNLQPGDVPHSLQSLEKRWGWSEMKVRRFIDELNEDGMIEKKRVAFNDKSDTKNNTKSDTRPMILSICNWKKYQCGGGDSRHQIRHQNEGLSRNLSLTEKDSIAGDLHQPAGSEETDPVFVELQVKDGKPEPILQSEVEKWKASYSLVDVEYLVGVRMRDWLETSPKNKQKTRKGVRRFITSWLGRDQETKAKQAKPVLSPSLGKKKEEEGKARKEAEALKEYNEKRKQELEDTARYWAENPERKEASLKVQKEFQEKMRRKEDVPDGWYQRRVEEVLREMKTLKQGDLL
jgi:DNA-binding Lrp family transcriptional regulator